MPEYQKVRWALLWVCLLSLALLPRVALAAPFRGIGDMVEPRAYHAAIRLADGRVLVLGGDKEHDSPAKTVLVFDPATQTWASAGALSQEYKYPTATLLHDGRVLVLGIGAPKGPNLGVQAAEVFNPHSTPPSSVSVLDQGKHVGRWGASTILLKDGRVLIVGGAEEPTAGVPYGYESVLFDPKTMTWTVKASNPHIDRTEATAVAMQDGRVLVAGGRTQVESPGVGNPSNTVEIFDPKTDTWSDAAPMIEARTRATSISLGDGRVLVGSGVGGDDGQYKQLTSVEIFDPKTSTWSLTGSVHEARSRGTALLLDDGRVLLIAGEGANPALAASAEVFEPRSGEWSSVGAVGGLDSKAYDGFSATLLGDGRVLVAGGGLPATLDDPGQATPGVRAELLDPRAQTWTRIDSTNAFEHHRAVTLHDGQALVTGGRTQDLFALGDAKILNPRTGMFRALGPMQERRSLHAMVVLRSGNVLVMGGEDAENGIVYSSVELFDVSTEQFSGSTPMKFARTAHTATLLQDGRVLVTGGTNSFSAGEMSRAEIFDPVSLSWSSIAPMHEDRVYHSATLLADGRVLVTGGFATTSEVFDPDEGTWTQVGPIKATNSRESAVRLLDGRVLVAGGFNDASLPIAAAELFDPTTNTFSSAFEMNLGRASFALSLLADGRVLAAGGTSDTSAEIFDPETTTWSLTSPMSVPHPDAFGVTLPDGRALILGNRSTGGADLTHENELFGLAVGTACDTDELCVGGHCVDGVCCDSACLDDESCRACTIVANAKTDGICAIAKETCWPNTCDPTTAEPTCRSGCEVAAECASTHVCNLHGECVKPENNAVEKGCTTTGEAGSSDIGIGWILLGGFFALRRRRTVQGSLGRA